MSDATDDLHAWERELLQRSGSDQLRAEMREFADSHATVGAKELRRRISGGTQLSTLVDEGRDERV